ncbi:hypothetical protein ElyMa_006000200 [Elysia marginata]|uniref:Uncharacterized protein n=1 Tax=Elysia marginata TaxID=1093978 RepID=A0AAV4GHK3_9GAST|nr:hypothetical protein ElyMa_006000200 [Elysia marginata]
MTMLLLEALRSLTIDSKDGPRAGSFIGDVAGTTRVVAVVALLGLLDDEVALTGDDVVDVLLDIQLFAVLDPKHLDTWRRRRGRGGLVVVEVVVTVVVVVVVVVVAVVEVVVVVAVVVVVVVVVAVVVVEL